MSKERPSHAISGLTDLVRTLRGPGGCPWDARQTDSTIKIYLLEETYEVLDALEKGDPGEVCRELGDLLFQIIFLACLAEERGEFDLGEVMERIHQKMIHRHPHVFGTVKVNGPSEVSENWARIKQEEKGGAWSASSALEHVPSNLPALLRAHRLDERASRAGFGTEGRDEAWEKARERFERLSGARERGDRDAVGKETGELLLDIVHLSRQWGLNAEDLLRGANREFIGRCKNIEEERGAGRKDRGETTGEETSRPGEGRGPATGAEIGGVKTKKTG